MDDYSITYDVVDKSMQKTKGKKKLPKFDKNDIPKPPKKDIIIKPKSNRLKFYIFPIISIFLSLLIFIILWLTNTRLLFIILYGILIFPLFFFSGIIFLIRLYLDKKRIKGKIIKKVSKNFIIANFYRENRRIDKIPLLINSDGQTFNYKKGLYMLSKSAIWLDENNYPNSYYVENIPNPLIFGFQKDINSFIKATLREDTKGAISDEGLLIDLSFSSETLAMFKKDKIFAEFMRDSGTMKIVYVLMGLIGLSFITIALVVIFVK